MALGCVCVCNTCVEGWVTHFGLALLLFLGGGYPLGGWLLVVLFCWDRLLAKAVILFVTKWQAVSNVRVSKTSTSMVFSCTFFLLHCFPWERCRCYGGQRARLAGLAGLAGLARLAWAGWAGWAGWLLAGGWLGRVGSLTRSSLEELAG
jgi:hypothetical protein